MTKRVSDEMARFLAGMAITETLPSDLALDLMDERELTTELLVMMVRLVDLSEACELPGFDLHSEAVALVDKAKQAQL